MTGQLPEPFIYIPEDSKINITNQPMPEIKVKYEEERMIFNREKVNEVVKGNYGRKSTEL